MRRSEKEITDRAEIDGIIRQCKVCHLGLCDGNQPYVVPVSFGYDGQAVYIHSARMGRKVDVLRNNNRVCVEFEIVQDLITGPQACDWSVHFKSVMGFGTAVQVDDPAEKRVALALLMAQYTDGEFTFPADMLARTAIIKVALETLTGKKSAPV